MTDIMLQTPPRTGGNENKDVVKIAAYVFMLIDHIGVLFLPYTPELRIFGRIAFPLFAWGIVVGSVYTRNIWKYALRLLIVGIISQPLYVFAMGHSWTYLNVFATLLLGLLGIAAIRENKFGSRYWGPVLAVLIACVFDMDYGFQGVLFILLLYGVRQTRASIVSLMIAYCLYWGFDTYTLRSFFGWPILRQVPFLPEGNKLISDLSHIQASAILSLPIMILPLHTRKEGFRLPQWVGYAIYPAHFLLFGLIVHWDQVRAFFGV